MSKKPGRNSNRNQRASRGVTSTPAAGTQPGPATEQEVPKGPELTTPAKDQSQPSRAQRPHAITTVLSIGALAVSIASFFNSCEQSKTAQRLSRLHVRPNIVPTIRQSSAPERSNDVAAAELVLVNKGPIKAVTVTASYSLYVIDTNHWIVSAMGVLPEYNDYTLVERELDIGQAIGMEILSAAPSAIFVVEISYYREYDMENFSDEKIFFFDSGNFFRQEDLTTRAEYQLLLTAFARYREARRTKTRASIEGLVTNPLAPPPSFILSVPSETKPRRLN